MIVKSNNMLWTIISVLAIAGCNANMGTLGSGSQPGWVGTGSVPSESAAIPFNQARRIDTNGAQSRAFEKGAPFRIVQKSTSEIVYLLEDSGTISVHYSYDAYSVPKPHNLLCTFAAPNNAAQVVNSIGVDRTGELWVPTGDGNIYSFGPNLCGPPGITLKGPTDLQPIGIAFNDRGTNFVLESGDGKQGETCILVFLKGKTSAARRLRLPLRNTDHPAGIGLDRLGNVYASYSVGYNQGVVVEFKNAKGSPINLHVLGLGGPGGSITFDKSGNMIVPDNSGTVADVFAPPYQGNPTNTISLKGTPWQCALNQSEKLLGCNERLTYPYRSANFYGYPSGSYKFSIPVVTGFSLGLAFDPAAPN